MPQTIRKFKQSMVGSRFTPIVFAIIAITLRLGMFLSVGFEQQQYPANFIWDVISSVFTSQWISLGASTASVFVIAFIITQINLRFSLIRFRTALPFSMLVLFSSIHPAFLPMSPYYISIIFILLALFPLLQSYQHHAPHIFAFKSGVLLGLATIFQVYTLFFYALWLYGEISMHGFRIKSFFALILGGILVFWNLTGLYFLFDVMHLFLAPFNYFERVITSIPSFTLIQAISIALLILLSGIFLILDYQVSSRERVLTQKTFSLFIHIIIGSFILHSIYFGQTLFFVFIMVIMMTFIVAHYYSHIKTKWQVFSFVTLMMGLFSLFINYLIGNPFHLY